MSEQHFQICRFCQRNIKLAFYCEDCGISCCSDCLNEEKVESFVCQDCNSKNVVNIDSGKKKVCKDCKSDHITQISQLLKSCPKCHSHKIINVYEKKEELEKGFLDLIKNVRTFIEPLRESANSLNDLRQKVIEARAPPVKCHHYSNMEADLLSLFKLLNYAKDNLLERVKNLIQHLSMNKDYFFNVYAQPNSNIHIIADILTNLTRTYHSIEDFIENNVNTINTSLEPFSKNLNFIQKITNYFKKYLRFLNLAAEEKPIYAIYAKLINGLNTQDKYKKSKGVLFITNFDLSFVHEYGRVKKKRETIFKAPVNDLIRVKIIGKVFKRLFIEFPYGRYNFTLPPNALNKVMDYILLARTFDETIVYDDKTANKLFDIDVDLTYLINFIEDAINSFFSLKCTYNKLNQNQSVMNSLQNLPQGLGTKYGENVLNTPYLPDLTRPKDFGVPLHLNPQLSPHTTPSFYQNDPYRPQLHSYPQNNNIKYYQDPTMIKYPFPLIYSQQSRPNYMQSYNEDDFFLQNFYDTSRIQNYQPSYFTNPLNTPVSAFDEKNLLMRRLEQLNKQNPGSQNSNMELNDQLNQGINYLPSQYQHEYSRNHLSNLFTPSYPPKNLEPVDYTSKIDKIKQKKNFELEQERFSLEETLKALDSKFESGNISEIDYFKNFKKLQKELYKIDKKINDLQEEIEEKEKMSRFSKNLERRPYFS